MPAAVRTETAPEPGQELAVDLPVCPACGIITRQNSVGAGVAYGCVGGPSAAERHRKTKMRLVTFTATWPDESPNGA